MNRYIPPSFAVYEFFAPEIPAGGSERRWFAHWDGRVGAPATDVVLAWASGLATVLVCTTDRVFDRAYARFRAAHLAFGGTVLPVASRPVGATQIVHEMERLRDDDEAWSTIRGLVDGAVCAEAAEDRGYTLAYTLFEGGAVLIAAVGVGPEHLRVRVARSSPTEP